MNSGLGKALFAFAVFTLISESIFSQSTSTSPSFEAAEIQLNKSGQLENAQILPSGRVVMRYNTLKQLIMGAYNVLDDRVLGGPAWINSDEFDLIAKAPPNSTIDDIRKMMQPLLAERFKLVIHHENKVMPVYALVVGNKGTKLSPTSDPSAKAGCAMRGGGRQTTTHMDCRNFTISHLAEMLPEFDRRGIAMPVVDMTGIQGAFDIQLDFMTDFFYRRALDAPDVAGSDPVVSIFDAVAKLGLILEKSRQPSDAIVIDSVQRL